MISFFYLLVVILFLLVRAIPGIPAATQDAAARKKDEEDFLNSIRAAGRWIPWAELEPRLVTGVGTLILEEWMDLPYSGIRFWWTELDVVSLAPVGSPPSNKLDLFGHCAPHPFVAWCFEQFLHPKSGKASLTEPDKRFWKRRHPNDEWGGDLPRRLYPLLRIVETAAFRHRCGRCDYDLRASKDRCPECGTPIPTNTNAR